MTVVEFTNQEIRFKQLADAVRSDSVTAFRLKDVKINGDEMCMIEFSKALRGHPGIEEFSLTNVTVSDPECNLDPAISMILVTTENIKMVNLDNTKVSTSGSLAAAGHCTTLKKLLLPNNGLTDDDAKILSTALSQSGSIQYVDLTGNAISDVGCAFFAKAVEKNISLSVLKLDGNGISGGAVSALEGVLTNRAAIAA
jgi:hypothetical protein